VWPIAMAYYVDVTVLGAWCELRNDFRHFRVERIIMATILNDLVPVWAAFDGTLVCPATREGIGCVTFELGASCRCTRVCLRAL